MVRQKKVAKKTILTLFREAIAILTKKEAPRTDKWCRTTRSCSQTMIKRISPLMTP